MPDLLTVDSRRSCLLLSQARLAASGAGIRALRRKDLFLGAEWLRPFHWIEQRGWFVAQSLCRSLSLCSVSCRWSAAITKLSRSWRCGGWRDQTAVGRFCGCVWTLDMAHAKELPEM